MAAGDVCHGPRWGLAGLGPVALEYRSCHWPGGLAGSPQCVRPIGCWFLPVPRPPYVCAVSCATWILFTGVPAWFVVLRLRCPGPLCSCSPVCSLGVLCCVCGVLGHLAPVHRCARSVCCFACAVSWVTWFLFTGFHSVCCVVCAVSWATWLLFTGVPAWFVVLCVRCPGPLGSCSPVCPLRGLCCLCSVLGHLAPVHRCARSVRCVLCAVSCATWLLFTVAPARCVASRVRRPGPLGSCSPVCPSSVLFCVCGVLGHLAPVHRCACSVLCFARAVSWATWLLLTGAPARCVVLRVWCPGPSGSCSPVGPLGVLCCVYGVPGHLAPAHGCARSVCCVAFMVSRATWLLFTGVPARCVVLRVQCPGPLSSCSPVCPLGVLCCVYGVPGHLAAAHGCAPSVLCFACAVSCATWLLFTGVPARCVVLRVRCPGPLGFCSPVCPLRVPCCVRGVLGHLAPVHRCTRSVCCFACAVSWAPWLLFTGVPAQLVVLRVRCPEPLGFCSPVCPLGALCCVYGVLSRLALVHRRACSVCCALCCDCGVMCAGRRCEALTCPSGQRLCVAGRGWVSSGRALVHPYGCCL